MENEFIIMALIIICVEFFWQLKYYVCDCWKWVKCLQSVRCLNQTYRLCVHSAAAARDTKIPVVFFLNHGSIEPQESNKKCL